MHATNKKNDPGIHRAAPIPCQETTLFLGLFDGHLAELLEVLHKFKGGLAGTCASGLVAFDKLCLGVRLELRDLRIDLFYECFHVNKLLN